MGEGENQPQPNPAAIANAEEIQHAPIKTLITEAKTAQDAQRAKDPVPPDPDQDESRRWGYDKLNTDKDYTQPEALQNLMTRLEGYPPKAGEKPATKPNEAQTSQEEATSLEDIHFHTYNEGPSEGILKKRESTRKYWQDDVKKRLQGQANELEEGKTDETRYLKRWLSEFSSHGGYGDLPWKYQDNSEEYNAMEIFLTKGGYGKSEPSYQSFQNAPKIIYETMRILRTPLENTYNGAAISTDKRASWMGIGKNAYSWAPEVYAKAILEKSQQIVGKERGVQTYKFEPYDLDMTVTAALACGEIKVAFDLIKLSPEFFPDQGAEAINSAFSRMQNTILQAREVTPHLATAIDEGLLCLGEEGTYKELGDSQIAKELKKQAEARVTEEIMEKRGDWYHSQEAVDINARMKGLGSDALRSLIEETAKNGKSWKEIAEQISQRTQDVVDGKAANVLSSELIRRMYPDLSVKDQLDKIKGAFLNKKTGAGYLSPLNIFDEDLTSQSDKTRFPNQSSVEKANTISNTYFPSERQLIDAIYNPNEYHTHDLQILIGMFRYPDNLPYSLDKAFKDNAQRSGSRGYDYDYTKDKDERIQTGRKVLAKRLVGGISFLQSCIEDPQIKALLDTQLGFKNWSDSLLTSDRLGKAQETLAKMFGDEVDKESGLTIYESMLPDPDQQAEDLATFKRLNAARVAEVPILKAEKTEEARSLVTTTIETRQKEKTGMETSRKSRRELSQNKTKAEGSVSQLSAELEDIQSIEVEDNAAKRFLKKNVERREVLTTLEKTARIISQQASIQATKEELATLTEELKKAPDISDQSYTQATQLLESLTKLASTN